MKKVHISYIKACGLFDQATVQVRTQGSYALLELKKNAYGRPEYLA